MSLENAIKIAFDKKAKREKIDDHGKWLYPMYWAIDLHDVIIPGTYTRNNEGKVLFPCAEEFLQWLTKRDDMSTILYTCSYPDAINDILEWLSLKQIRFNYVNENPDCKNGSLCDFSKKFYYDILLDDKAGFDANQDWFVIKNVLVSIGKWS